MEISGSLSYRRYFSSSRRLKLSAMGRLRPLRSLFYFKADFVPLLKGFEAAALNAAVMDKNILPIFGFYEAIAFLLIKPFHSTVRHAKLRSSDDCSHSNALPRRL